MKNLKKILSLILCLVAIMTLFVGIASLPVSAATQSFSNTAALDKFKSTSNMERGSYIYDSIIYENSVLKVQVPSETHLELKTNENLPYKAYLSAIPASNKPQQGSSGYTRAIWIKYKVKSIGNGGYAQVGIGYTSTLSNSFSNTTILGIDNKVYEAGDTEYSFAVSIPYKGSQEYRFVFSGYKDVEYEITSIKWASKRSTNYAVVRYHIGNNFMYPVFCNNEAQKTTGFSSLGAEVNTVNTWYDENDSVVSGKLITSTTGYSDIDLYDLPKEATGTRAFSASGVNWYSDTVTNSFSSGDGTANNPYIVKTAAELRFAIASGGRGKYYKLGNNIAVNASDSGEWYNNRGLKNWKSTDDSADLVFQGNFDGAGHKISGVLINYNSQTGESSLGLFPIVNGAVIKNLMLENICIKAETVDNDSNHTFGGLIGKAAVDGVTVENVVVKSVMIDTRGFGEPANEKIVGIGGVIGFADSNVSVKDVTVKSFDVKNNFTNSKYHSFSGGIVGYVSIGNNLNISNAIAFDLEPISVNLHKLNGKVSNVWGIGDDISLNSNYSGLKTSNISLFYGNHKDFVNNLSGSSNWLPDKLCFMPTLKSFASEQTEQHGEHLEATCKLGERCEYCGKVFDTTLNPDNHINVLTKNGIPYTCDMIGFGGDLYCGDCNKLLGDGQSVDALGHDYGEWKIIKNATTNATGIKERICKRSGCGYVDREEIPVLTETKTETNTSVDNKKPIKNNKPNENDKTENEPEVENTTSSSPIKNGEKGTVTIFKSADNTVRVVLLIAIPSAILLAGIVLSVLILVKKKR